MDFDRFRDRMTAHIEELILGHDRIFEVDCNSDSLYEMYLNSYPEGTNPIFRVRRQYDCSACRRFIKDFGGAVFIDDDLTLHTIWEFEKDDPVFGAVAKAMDAWVRTKPIRDVFLSREERVGVPWSVDGELDLKWAHFTVEVPKEFVIPYNESEEHAKSQYRDAVKVFYRSLEEIRPDAVDTVLELIASNSLYRGQEWEAVLTEFRKHKRKFDLLPTYTQRELYVWLQTGRVGPSVSRIRNHAIGVLLTDLSENKPLDEAVASYEKIVAPANYKRPKAIFTEKMLEEAREKIETLGYMESLPRRYATLDDIRVNNILFSNKDAAKRIIGASVFDEMMAEAEKRPKKFDRIEEIPIDTFLSRVLPTAKEISAYVENRHEANFVSLIAPVNADAPSMFKWDNAFSWAYAGNITDSNVKQNVKNAGGCVDGVLRFSIQWNDLEEYSRNDLDAHCIEPQLNHIYWGNKVERDGGTLDIDITNPQINTPAVENITWPDKRKMRPGKYRFYVHQYKNRGGRDGFRAEIEFDGQIFKFDYRKELRQDERVDVAEVVLYEDRRFSIKTLLPTETAGREIWGIRTMDYVPVSTVMFSPNYWDEQTGIGHRHVFFMLKGCKNPEEPNGFYNEFLKQDLMEHKRVFEALGWKMKVAYVDDQLSGIGFSTTKRGNVVLKVNGATERVMKVTF